jgi:hypothetical protein
LKSQAKDLLDAFKRNDAAARERAKESLPALASGALDAKDFALHDAQSVVAREYGFASWAELRAHVESLANDARADANDAADAPSRELLRTLMAGHPGAPFHREIEDALVAAGTARPQHRAIEAGALFPMLPLRNAMLAMGAVAPLDIGRPSTLAAIEAARANGGLMAAFSQRDGANESPKAADIHPVGCLVELLKVIEPADRPTKVIVVRAAQWIALDAIEKSEPFLLARVSPFAVSDEADPQVAPLERTLRERVGAIAKGLPGGERLVAMTSRMNARELADAVLANVPCSVDDKARCASEPSLPKRIGLLLVLLGGAPA